jgi:hypothetical protein
MIIKLNKKQLDYLIYILTIEQEILKSKLQVEEDNHSFIVRIDEDTADEIRDLAGEELQKKGFDSNYELTQDGKMLEELIDVFYKK